MSPTPPQQARILLIHGNDEFLVDQEARSAIDAWCPGARENNVLTTVRGDVETIEEVGKAVRETLLSSQSFSMFGDQNVTWLRGVKFLTGKAFQSVEVKESVERLCGGLTGGLGPEQIVIISVSGKVDARSRFLKAVSQVGEVREFKKSDKPWEVDKETEALFRKRLEDRGIRAAQRVLTACVERLGPETRMMVSEVEKLDVYLGDRRELREEDVELMISPLRETAPWLFGEAVGAGDLGRALQLLRQMQERKVSAIALVALLHNQFREMALYRALLARKEIALERAGSFGSKLRMDSAGVAEQIAAVNGGRKSTPFRQAKLAEQSLRYSPSRLDRMSRMTAEAYRQQFLSALPDFLQLELLVLRLLAPDERSSLS